MRKWLLLAAAADWRARWFLLGGLLVWSVLASWGYFSVSVRNERQAVELVRSLRQAQDLREVRNAEIRRQRALIGMMARALGIPVPEQDEAEGGPVEPDGLQSLDFNRGEIL